MKTLQKRAQALGIVLASTYAGSVAVNWHYFDKTSAIVHLRNELCQEPLALITSMHAMKTQTTHSLERYCQSELGPDRLATRCDNRLSTLVRRFRHIQRTLQTPYAICRRAVNWCLIIVTSWPLWLQVHLQATSNRRGGIQASANCQR